MDSSQVTRSPKSSCDTGTPTQSPAKPSNTSLQRSPSKTPISAEMRARIEENRRRAQEIKARNQHIARMQERADQEADRRAAGEKYLREFGIGSTSKQKLEASSANATFHHHPEESNPSFELDCHFLPNHKPPPQPYTPDPRCSAEQLKVLDLVKLGRNVFFTGSAGVGKSFMLHEVVRMLKSEKRRVSVTAPTGIAALAIGGCTIHSWARVGLGQGSAHALYNKLIAQKHKSAKFERDTDTNRIWNTDVLIVDEISMLHPDLFEKISILCQAIRKIKKPFGGIQIILSGDFFQLPPVAKDDDFTCMYCGCPKFERVGSTGEIRCVKPLHKKWDDKPCGRVRKEFTFCFETPTWRQLKLQVIELTQVFRQEDKHFIDMLNKIRWGTVDDEIEEIAVSRSQPLEAHEIKPTRLYARNMNVHAENAKQFGLLDSKPYEFSASDQTMGNAPYAHTFLSRLEDLQARKKLTLKIGAQVMLLCNLDIKGKLVNGSRGVVIDWVERPSHQLSSVLSQQRDPDDMKKMYWCSKQANSCLPKVLFSDGRVILIEPFVWNIEIDASLTLCRTQLPLSLAWAITIHKSQGQTLDRLCVDLFGIFEHGQAYVALSRARSLQGLQITGWKSSRVQCHPSVKDFYKSLHEVKRSQEEDFLDPEDFFPFSDCIEFMYEPSPSPEPSPRESVHQGIPAIEYLPSDERKVFHEGVTSKESTDADLISSGQFKSLCLKKANLTDDFGDKNSIGSDLKPQSDSKLHIDPLLGGSSPSVSDDLLDDDQLISVAEEVERSQGDQQQRLSQSKHVDQVEQIEIKVDPSSLHSPAKDPSFPETEEIGQDLRSPTPVYENRPPVEIEKNDHQPEIKSEPLTRRRDLPVPIMQEIDDNRHAKSPPFTIGADTSIHEMRITDNQPALPSPAINKDPSFSRIKAIENNQCVETLLSTKGHYQPSPEVPSLDQNQLRKHLPTKKRKEKRKLSEYDRDEGIRSTDVKKSSKRVHTIQAEPLFTKDEANFLGNCSHTHLITRPYDLVQADPVHLYLERTNHTRSMNDPIDRSGYIDSGSTAMSINHPNSSSLAVDVKPNINPAEPVVHKSDTQKTPFDESEFSKTILNDFSRRIRNSVLMLNKSLHELPSGPYAREFDSESVEEHVRMLVGEHFCNPHLVNQPPVSDTGTRSREIGQNSILEGRVIENIEQLGKANNTRPLDAETTPNHPIKRDGIDGIFRRLPPGFHCNDFHAPF